MDIIFNHMVNYLFRSGSLVLRAVERNASWHRGYAQQRAVVRLANLQSRFKMSLAAISKHVKILEDAQLLIRKKSGRIHECSINPEAMKSVTEKYVRFYTILDATTMPLRRSWNVMKRIRPLHFEEEKARANNSTLES